MDNEEILTTRVCYRCGAVNGDYTFNDLSAIHHCGECGEEGVVTVQQTMDILNQLVLDGTIVLEEISEIGYDIYEDSSS